MFVRVWEELRAATLSVLPHHTLTLDAPLLFCIASVGVGWADGVRQIQFPHSCSQLNVTPLVMVEIMFRTHSGITERVVVGVVLSFSVSLLLLTKWGFFGHVSAVSTRWQV